MKINNVVILYKGMLEPEPEVFKTDKEAEDFIIAHCKEQGKDYIKLKKHQITSDEYVALYAKSDYEIYWFHDRV